MSTARPDPLGELGTAAAPNGPPPPAPPETRLAALLRQGEEASARVGALLTRARRRAGRLGMLRAGLLFVSGLALVLLAAALLAALFGPLAGRVALLLLALAGAGLFVLFFRRSPLQRAVVAARDPRALARLLCDPGLGAASGGSELLSSVELQQHPPQGTSRELLALLHQRAAEAAGKVDLEAALPTRLLHRPAALLGATLLVILGVLLLSPRPLQLGALRLWLGEAAAPPAEPDPIAGDLSITYLYPAYTGLPPRVEEGTAGDLRAPRGTEVRIAARADRDLDQAFAVYNGQAVQLEASGPGHRLLAGTLTLRDPGRWHLRFSDSRGRAVAEGPPRPVEVIPDQPPQVVLSEPSKPEVEVDPQGKVVLSWSASDDYGLEGAWLVYQRPGEKEERVLLGAPPDPGVAARRLSGSYGWQMAPLQLRPGDRVSFHIEARDQDAVDGPQKGVSPVHTLKVFSAAEHHREALLRAQQLWERLIGLLGDRLEEKPAPAAAAEAQAWFTPLSARDQAAQQLVGELGRVGHELARDKLAPPSLGRALQYVQSSLSPLVQRTALARAPLTKGATGQAGPQQRLAQALGSEVREEEKDVLYLEDLLDQARLDDLKQLQAELQQSRRELARLAEKLRKAPDEATKKELLAEVARLRERVQELMRRMAEMAKGVRDEHLNQEAMQAVEKDQDVMSQLADVQKKLQSGDVDAALKQLDELGQQLEKLEGNLDKEQRSRGEEKYSEEAKALREAAEKLGKLQAREEQLEKRTGELRRKAQEEARRNFEQRGGKDLGKRLLEKVERARKEVAKVDPKLIEPLGLEEQLDQAEQRTADLSRALQGGDFEEALEQANRAKGALNVMQGRLTMEEQYHQLQRPADVRRSAEAVERAQGPMREVLEQLQRALPGQGQSSPEEQKELKAQAAEQRALKQELQSVRQQLGEVGKKLPVFGPQHEQLLQDAEGAMGRAEQRLGQGEPRGAQSGEAQAREKLAQFEQAMKDLAQKGGGGGGGVPLPWGDPKGQGEEGEGDGDGTRHEPVAIPDAESSRGPQEFRKKLLDAMKQPPPEKFRDRVRQYYEELVK